VRLLADAMLGDPTLFTRSDEVEAAWRLYTPLLELMEDAPWQLPVHPYEAGTWGPSAADNLLADDGLIVAPPLTAVSPPLRSSPSPFAPPWLPSSPSRPRWNCHPRRCPTYLSRLWSDHLKEEAGAATFTLVVWEPSWLQQQLIRTGRIDGPISGLLNDTLLEAARQAASDLGLPASTAPTAPEVAWALGQQDGQHSADDLRGQFVDRAISAHQPRRLITLAPTLAADRPLETLVAAYCPSAMSAVAAVMPAGMWWCCAAAWGPAAGAGHAAAADRR
jgi:hypothetical protein